MNIDQYLKQCKAFDEVFNFKIPEIFVRFKVVRKTTNEGYLSHSHKDHKPIEQHKIRQSLNSIHPFPLTLAIKFVHSNFFNIFFLGNYKCLSNNC
jgi:hypothetical protein